MKVNVPPSAACPHTLRYNSDIVLRNDDYCHSLRQSFRPRSRRSRRRNSSLLPNVLPENTWFISKWPFRSFRLYGKSCTKFQSAPKPLQISDQISQAERKMEEKRKNNSVVLLIPFEADRVIAMGTIVVEKKQKINLVLKIQ